MKLVPIGEAAEIHYMRDGVIKKTKALAMRNPEKGIVSNPILNERTYLEVFGMIIQPLSYEIIQAIQFVDPFAQIEMLQTIDQEKPMLVVTHIYQGTQADEMEWPLGELIIKANNQEIHTIEGLQKIIEKNKGNTVLLECLSGTIGYFQVDLELESHLANLKVKK
jgi:S1-C subfamily serine protease